MRDAYAAVADQLARAGFRESESGCFISLESPRVVGLAVCQPDPKSWPEKTEELLRKEPMRVALSWARYVVLLIDARKTSALAWAAAAFAQDVSKCRRIAIFVNANDGQVTLPFVGLPSLGEGTDAPPRDLEVIVRDSLTGSLADAFLNEDIAGTKVQELAEKEE